MALKPDKATLVAVLLQGILFGLFTTLYGVALHLLRIKRTRRPFRIPHVLVATTMYILGLLHVIIDFQRLAVGFTERGYKEPSAYFASTRESLYIINSVVSALQICIGDGVLTYRLYIIWQRRKFIVMPLVLCIVTCLGTFIGLFVSFSKDSRTATIFSPRHQGLLASSIALTLVINLGCTVLIVLKIVSTMRQTAGVLRSYKTTPALSLVVESGTIYLVFTVASLVGFLSKSCMSIIFITNITQLIGVTYTLIIVRIGLQLPFGGGGQISLPTLRAHEAPRDVDELRGHNISVGTSRNSPTGFSEMIGRSDLV